MVFFQPEQCAANQKTSHLVAAIIENVGTPVRMEALARVGMLKKMRAIKETETMAIRRKMRGHPVQDDSYVVSMERIDEIHEILWGSKIAGRSEVSGGLVPPGAKKRVIHDRQELYMGKPHLLEISRQGLSKFAVAQRTVSLLRNSSPRSDMHLIDGHWSIQRIPLMPVFHPGVILPRVLKVPDNRRCLRRNFVKEGEGIGLIDLIVAASCSDMKLVERAFTDT